MHVRMRRVHVQFYSAQFQKEQTHQHEYTIPGRHVARGFARVVFGQVPRFVVFVVVVFVEAVLVVLIGRKCCEVRVKEWKV